MLSLTYQEISDDCEERKHLKNHLIILEKKAFPEQIDFTANSMVSQLHSTRFFVSKVKILILTQCASVALG